jgi:hypothetical protein
MTLPYCARNFIPSVITMSIGVVSTRPTGAGASGQTNMFTSLVISYSDSTEILSTSVELETSLAISTYISVVSTIISGQPTVISTSVQTVLTFVTTVSLIPETITFSVPVTITEVVTSVISAPPTTIYSGSGGDRGTVYVTIESSSRVHTSTFTCRSVSPDFPTPLPS